MVNVFTLSIPHDYHSTIIPSIYPTISLGFSHSYPSVYYSFLKKLILGTFLAYILLEVSNVPNVNNKWLYESLRQLRDSVCNRNNDMHVNSILSAYWYHNLKVLTPIKLYRKIKV